VTVARLRTDVGERPSPAGISKAEERLRSALCRQGFPYTAAKASQTRLAEAVLDLEFEIDVGGSPVRIVDVRVVGAKLPGDLLEAVGLTPGASYCRDLAGEASDVVGAYLRDNGFPNALVFVESRRRGPNKVAIHVTVDKRERATVSRVWFRGHKVTLEKVLRQLVSVKPGQRFQQSEIARSVENLRRSGLFRRVSHSVIESLDVGDIYVVFELVESDLLEVDFGARTVFLHNMDISWPSSVAAATDGVTLRGGGQRVRLTGASDHVGVGIRDPFLWSGLLATGDIDLVFHSFNDLEETETKIQVGAGLTALENQFEAILLMFLSQTVRGAPNAYDVLPFRGDRGGASAGLGLALRLDLTRLDAERIAYLGLGLNASARSADLLAGKPWTSTSTAAALNLPLFRNGRGQHYVLQLKSRWRLLFDAGISGGSFADDDELYAHRMLTPRARGYAGTALRATHLVDGKEILIGHRATWESTVAVRIPLPFRRNAIRVFADLASGGPLELRPWDPDTIRPGIGIGLDFSLFDERLEGTLDGTYPLSDGPAVEYYSLAVGGSFD
jgi:hypothetical protein